MSSSAITGPILSDTRRAPSGTAAAPSFAFNDSTGTGAYLVSAGVLGLSTAGVQRVVVDASGNVGIGTASPLDKLHMNHISNAALRATTTTNSTLAAFGADNIGGYLGSFSAHPLVFYAGGGTERMRLDANGVVSMHEGAILGTNKGISFGLTATDGRFKMATALLPSSGHNATIGYNSNTGIVSYVSSSRLVKSEITPISYGLDAVMSLQPRNYVNQVGEKKVGFIADEVEAVIPELVGIGEKKVFTNKEEDTEMIPISVHYQDMTAVLCKAIQEQQAMIEELKAKVSALEAK
jgi:hypothetical protein